MLRVRDAMSRKVVTISPEASAAEALALLTDRNIRHLPVVEGQRLVGLLSDRDLRDMSPARSFASGDQENTLGWVRVRDMMTTGLATAKPLDTIEHAARQIHERRVHCLPVVDGEDLVGIITSSDLNRVLTELVGGRGPGSWVEVEVVNEPGALARVAALVGEGRVNIGGVFLGPGRQASHRVIVLRLESTDPSGVARALSEAGYTVDAIESSSPVESTYEES